MENNEYEEIQGQLIEEDVRLENEVNRTKKLRKIAFECKSQTLIDDKMLSLVGAGLLLVLLPLIAWFLIEYAFPMAHIWSHEFLFWFGIGLLALIAIGDIVSTIVIYKKLNLKSALDDDVPTVTARFDEFKKNYKTLSIIELILFNVFIIIACVWCCMSLKPIENTFLVTLILFFVLVSVALTWYASYYIRRIMSTCDSLVELIKI